MPGCAPRRGSIDHFGQRKLKQNAQRKLKEAESMSPPKPPPSPPCWTQKLTTGDVVLLNSTFPQVSNARRRNSVPFPATNGPLKQLAERRDPEELRQFQAEIDTNLKKRLRKLRKAATANLKKENPRVLQPLVRTASYENRVKAAVQKASQRVRRQSCDAAMQLTNPTAPKLPPHAQSPPNSQGAVVGVKALPPTAVPEYTRAHTQVAVTPLAAHGAAQQRVREHKRKQAEEIAAQAEQEASRAQKMQTDQQTAVHQAKLAARRLVLRKMMKEESKMAFLMARASADSRVSAAVGAVDATPIRSRRGSISQKEQAEEKRRLGWSSDEKQIRALIRWQGARHIILGGIRIKHAMELAAERKAKADAEREGVLQMQIAAMKAEAKMLLANNDAGKLEGSSVINGNVSGGNLAVGA